MSKALHPILLRSLAAIASSLLVICLGACRAGMGPCVHQYREPVLNFAAAADAGTGARIDFFVIREVRVDGRLQDLAWLTPESRGVEVRDDSLICHPPCGFGTSEGNYTFTVSAPGYPEQVRGYEARYRVFKGGCPSYNDGGAHVTLHLRQDPNQPSAGEAAARLVMLR